MLGAGLIGRGLQRAEQEIQAAGAVGADIGQFCGGFRRPLLLPLRRELRVLRLRESGRQHDHCCDHRAKENSAFAGLWESRCHWQSLDAEKRAAKQHGVKQL